jgi:hypothetical protein
MQNPAECMAQNAAEFSMPAALGFWIRANICAVVVRSVCKPTPFASDFGRDAFKQAKS